MSKEDILKDMEDKISNNTDINAINFSDKYDTYGIHDNFLNVSLVFNEEWYKNNTEVSQEFIIKFIKNYTKSSIAINNINLITDDVISAIANNSNIKEVELTRFYGDVKYKLSKKHYEILKEAGITKIVTNDVEDDLKEVFDPIITVNYNKKMIGNNSYKDLQGNYLKLNNALSKEELNNLKYIGPNLKLVLDEKTNITDILNTLNSYNKDNKIVITMNKGTKKKVNESLLSLGYISKDGSSLKKPSNNIYLEIGIDEEININDYIKYENQLYSFVKDAQGMTPFERYIYAYDIVKQFKEYAKPEEDNDKVDELPQEEYHAIRDKSRNLYQILNNDYMVCTGFSNFLKDLLDKLDIPSVDLSVNVELSSYKAMDIIKEKYPNWKELTPIEKHNILREEQLNISKDEYEAHSRMMVNIVDPKYGINGMYFSDATFDNSTSKNLYNHMLMTSDYIDDDTSKLKFEPENILFFASNIKEFKEMFKTCIEKYLKEKKESKSPLSVIDNIIHLIRYSYLDKVEQLFPTEYAKLVNKYPFIETNGKWPFEGEYKFGKEINNMLNDLARIIVNNKGKKVSREVLYNGVKEVYKDIYVDGLSEEELNKIQNDNDNVELFNYGEIKTR